MRIFIFNLLTNPKTANAVSSMKGFNYSDTHARLFQKVASSPVEDMTVEETAALRPKMHQALAESSPNTVFVKTHSCLCEQSGIDQITMDVTSGAIYILRNPLDVCISMAPHFGITTDEAIDWMVDDGFIGGGDVMEVPYIIGAWSRHVESWTKQGSSSSLHIVRYEDMTYKPGPTFKAVAKFMGLKPTTEMLKKAIKLSSFDTVKSQEEETGFEERSVHAEKFFRVGKANQWKTVLTKEQIDKVVEGNYDMMKKFNYLPPEYK